VNYLTAGFVNRNLLTCDYERGKVPRDELGGEVADGKFMLRRCTSKKQGDFDFCRGFALGIAHMSPTREGPFCPENVNAAMLLEVAVRFMIRDLHPTSPGSRRGRGKRA
jgi:hypothetical protein